LSRQHESTSLKSQIMSYDGFRFADKDGLNLTSALKLLFASVALAAALTVDAAHSETPDQIDQLTRQWIDTDRQASHLQTDWQAQQPILEQRLALLKAEKAQLQGILKDSGKSQSNVETQRAKLLAQQAELEKQQQELNQGLAVLNKRIEAVNKRLPPPLQETWRNEQDALGEQPTPSLRLQVSLAQLSSLADFDQRISVHQMPILKEDAGEILVKQFYLGLGMAWFVSADGQFSGWGQADEEGWNWQVSENINAKEISKAIAIFEKRQQAEFVRLPVMLANTSGTLPPETLIDKTTPTNRREQK